MNNHKTPNAETIAAMEEVQKMKDDPSLGKAYTDIDELINDMLE